MNKKLIAQLILIFLITQAFGLFVASELIAANIDVPAFGEDKNDVMSAVFLFVYILVFTGILLLIMKFYKGRGMFKLLEAIIILSTTWIVVDVLLPGVGLLFAVLMVALRNVLPKHIMLRNVSSIIAVVGAGALIGISLGWFPVLVFMVLLSVYDIIAVFGTKHMVTMGKAMTQNNLAFTVAMPTKEHTFEMGTGDLVIPLTFAVSLMAFSFETYGVINLIPSVLVLFGSLVGLLWTIDYSSKHVGTALPALPPQTLCMLVMFGIVIGTGLF